MTHRPHHRFSTLALLMACLWSTPTLAADDHGHGPAPAAKAAPAKAAAAAKGDEHGAKLASAAPTADAAADPLDRLRQKLSERLSGGRSGDAPGGNDVRVVVKTETLHAAPAARHGAAASKGPKGPKGHTKPAATAGTKATAMADAHGGAAGTPAPHTPHWSYQGEGGPKEWSNLRPDFSLCSTGQRQSPIDIRGGLSVELEPVRFDYQPSRFAVVDNGHTVQVNLSPGNAIEVGGRRFELVQFHFHRPSEERIDGKQFEMSLHLVHKDDQGRLAVVALLFDKGARQPALQKVWNNMPLEKNQEAAARTPLELMDLLPEDRRYFTYMGSLTTPPCSEGVQWIVMRQPVTAAPDQIELFSRIYPMNARPIQAAAGRRIMQSQ